MSKSDTCIEASRELLHYMKDDGEINLTLAEAIATMLVYVVKAEASVGGLNIAAPTFVQHAVEVFRQHLEDTPDWTGSVESRLDDFNVIHASLRDWNFKPEYCDREPA